ncbi:hypothetical protein N7478_009275 [Penicillium angulare]|uniref:uncharacterized protein n=1 Tax=Penicillium angulare TaxID=116970 RepID=UPI0025404F43|nr:uncharacterized protein N7478_009275 [Penicillium angulare]KAJ5266467.1 hypothetical protein N7478_009275 [Penicillium angulare]
MDLNSGLSSPEKQEPHVWSHKYSVSQEGLAQSPDPVTIDSIYDADIFYNQAWSDYLKDNSHLETCNTPQPGPLFVQDGVAMDGSPLPLVTDQLFPDIWNSPLPTELVESLNGSSPSNASTAPSRAFNFPFQANLRDQEMNLDHGASYPKQLDYQEQSPATYASNPQPSLPRRRSRYFNNVPNSRNKDGLSYDSNEVGLDPMQRWQENSPENEAASVTAIINAMQETPGVHRTRQPSRGRGRGPVSSRSRRSASATSRGSSASSTDSAWSTTSYSPRTRARRPHARLNKAQSDNGKPRLFCCTFCCDRFGTRYEWVRHEKSLHLNLEAWYCAPLGPSVLSLITGKEFCAYCNETEPSKEHLVMHNYDACQNIDNEHRSFRRKDHLVQHLRHVHQVQDLPPLDDWKKEMKNFVSRCGFCDQTLDNWDIRVSHLSQHFRNGLTMKDWKGDHGFPPHIVEQLRNAYPPYLLGWESECMIPFSATNSDVGKQYAHLLSATDFADVHEQAGPTHTEIAGDDKADPQLPQFLDIFTRHLSQYAQRQMEHGVVPTDEMFQREARKVLFSSEDAWDQTIADNSDWLSAFRKLHLQPTGSSVNIP